MPLGIPPSLFGLRVSGDVAGMTCYTDRYGRNVFYHAAPAQKPPTPAQTIQRTRFAAAMAFWKDLTKEEKNAYRQCCDHLSFCMLGHNLWIVLSLLPTDTLYETLQRQCGFHLALPMHV